MGILRDYYLARSIAGLFKGDGRVRQGEHDDFILKTHEYVNVWWNLAEAYEGLVRKATLLALVCDDEERARFYADDAREDLKLAKHFCDEFTILINRITEAGVDFEHLAEVEQTLDELKEEVQDSEETLDEFWSP